MNRSRLPVTRLSAATFIWALPGLAVVAALAFLGVLPPLWALGAGIGCLFIAGIIASPIARDLTVLLRYGDELAHQGRAGPIELSGWAPASELAATMRRIQRETETRERARQPEGLPGHQLFDALPQPLMLLDSRRRVRSLNRSARELVGSDPTGSDLSAAIRDPRVLDAVDEVVGQKTRCAVGFTVPTPVERYFWAEIVPFEKPYADGSNILLALYDLTERRRAEQMRADFVANASHELRTPLATLIGFIETLQGPARDDDEARANFLSLMAEQATRMSRLVKDLLSLSSVELNEHTSPETAIDVATILRRVANTLEIEAGRRDVGLVLEVPERVGPVIGDEEQMTQVFQNLIDNAIKYGRRGGTVRIRAETSDVVPAALRARTQDQEPAGVVRIDVTDQGDGIPAEHIPRLTERFYRVDAARSRAVGGTGLGLAIVKHIVNRHRGLLEVESEVGVGSTFRVILPRAR